MHHHSILALKAVLVMFRMNGLEKCCSSKKMLFVTEPVLLVKLRTSFHINAPFQQFLDR